MVELCTRSRVGSIVGGQGEVQRASDCIMSNHQASIDNSRQDPKLT